VKQQQISPKFLPSDKQNKTKGEKFGNRFSGFANVLFFLSKHINYGWLGVFECRLSLQLEISSHTAS
jgi:hypothetical protein